MSKVSSYGLHRNLHISPGPCVCVCVCVCWGVLFLVLFCFVLIY